ncbi:DUF4124 domain-containing protein [Litoribacillus peritrichatus]
MDILWKLLSVCFVCSVTMLADAQIYSWVDEQGVRHYSNRTVDADKSHQLHSVSKTNAMVSHAPVKTKAQTNKPDQNTTKARDDRKLKQAQCLALKEKMKQLRLKLKKGYPLKKANTLKAKKREMSKQYRAMCA